MQKTAMDATSLSVAIGVAETFARQSAVFVLALLSVLQMPLVSSTQIKKTMILPEGMKQHSIVKPHTDNREYLGLVCPNGARILLISDPETDKSAVALNTGVGSIHESLKYHGVAHLVEHMMFMGSEKYPAHDAFSKYMENHGGSTNAFTDDKSTVYIFDIAPAYFKGAFDVFAHAFIKPLFTDTGLASEINAVNQEHEKNMATDAWRYRQIVLDTMDKHHPMARFFTGNTYTLKTLPEADNVSSEWLVRDFYDRMYSSNLINLVVLSKESLQELADLIVPLVSQIRNKQISLKDVPSEPFARTGKLVKIVPVKESHHLNIIWTIPPLVKHYKSTPFRVLSKLLEGSQDGGLLAYLETRGWTESFSFAEMLSIPGCSVAEASFTLSSAGMDNWEEIVHLFYAYLEHYRLGIEHWRFDEYQKIFETEFRYQEKVSPWSYVTNIVDELPLYEMEHALTGGSVMQEIRSDLVASIIDALTPKKCNVYISSQKYADSAKQTEQWYGTKFAEEYLSPDLIKKWEDVSQKMTIFFKPPPNSFLPNKFDLLAVPREERDVKSPRIIAKNKLVTLWHKQDDVYKRPKAYAMLSVVSSDRYIDKEVAVAYDLYTQALSMDLRRELSQARRCGYTLSLKSMVDSLQITLGGFDDKLELLCKTVVSRLFNVFPLLNEYNLVHEATLREYRNARKQKQSQHAVMEFGHLMGRRKFTSDELLPFAERMTYERFLEMREKIIEHIAIDVLVFGNIDAKRSEGLLAIIADCMTEARSSLKALASGDRDALRETYIPAGSSYLRSVRNEAHPSNAVLCRFQIAPYVMPSYVHGMLFVEMFEEHFFDVLRTVEHLGYIANLDFSYLKHSYFIGVFVQSERSVSHVLSRIEHLMNETGKKLSEMSDTEFREHLESLQSRIEEKPKNMHDQGLRWFKEFTKMEMLFDRRDRILEVLKTTTKRDVVDFYEQYLAPGGKDRRQILIFVQPEDSMKLDLYNKFKGEQNDTEGVWRGGAEESIPAHIRMIEEPVKWINSMPKVPIPL